MSVEDFDFSDVGLTVGEDSLDDVLGVAVEVLTEYGPHHGRSRIERLARWLVMNLGDEPYGYVRAGSIEQFTIDPDLVVSRVGSLVGVTSSKRTGAMPEYGTDARRAMALAIAAIRASERARAH